MDRRDVEIRRRDIAKPLFLLPFVHGIDNAACTQAFALAQQAQADLLLVAFLPPARGGRKQIRPEMIAQAYDFFEFMKGKAARYQVHVTCTHLSTSNVARSIQQLAQEMMCTGILLFVREGQGVFLETEVIKHLLSERQLSLYIIRLEPHKINVARYIAVLATWLGAFFKDLFYKTEKETKHCFVS